MQHASGGVSFNTSTFNATGHPAISVNAGWQDGLMPVGVMIVAKHWQDALVLRVARAIELAVN